MLSRPHSEVKPAAPPIDVEVPGAVETATFALG